MFLPLFAPAVRFCLGALADNGMGSSLCLQPCAFIRAVSRLRATLSQPPQQEKRHSAGGLPGTAEISAERLSESTLLGYWAAGEGSVAEWFKALVLKTSVGGTPPWVRIPPLPPMQSQIAFIYFPQPILRDFRGLSTHAVRGDLPAAPHRTPVPQKSQWLCGGEWPVRAGNKEATAYSGRVRRKSVDRGRRPIQPWRIAKRSPFRYFKTSPEIIRLVVMMYIRLPLSLRNFEDMLQERGIEISHETVRYWWHR